MKETNEAPFSANEFILKEAIGKLENYIHLNECEDDNTFLNYMPVYYRYNLNELVNNPSVSLDSSVVNELLTLLYRDICNLYRPMSVRERYNSISNISGSLYILTDELK